MGICGEIPTCENAQTWQWDTYYNSNEFVISPVGRLYRSKVQNENLIPDANDDATWELIDTCRDDNCDTAAEWDISFPYLVQTTVVFNCKLYRSILFNVCKRPDQNPDIWEYIEDCSGDCGEPP